MPFSFIDIEEKKSRAIALLFIFIILIYFFTAYLLLLVVENSIFLNWHVEGRSGFFFPPTRHVLAVLLAALFAAFLHWALSTDNLIAKLAMAAGAIPLDPQDTYHQYFSNIVDEVSIAIGGRKIEPMVIRSASLNAFSIADFQGRSVIGITEGLLSRLNRSHIEAVVAHEAGHIASGDSLPATVLASLGELYEEVLGRVQSGIGHSRGRGTLFLWLIYLVLMLTSFLSKLLRFFLSREREFRADAIAVRLTREPLSLAEALKLISRGWRGNGAAGEYLQSIFIINPRHEDLDETEGLYPDMFSTHPPVKKRVAVLLSMAHLDEKALDERLKNFQRVSPVAKPEFVPDDTPAANKWFVFNTGAWQGPFASEELKGLAWFLPTQWIKPEGQEQVKMACDEPQLQGLFRTTQAEPGQTGEFLCPTCKVPLGRLQYEGASILKCSYCSGAFVEDEKIGRIMIRQDYTPSEEIVRLAKIIAASKDEMRLKEYDTKPVWARSCPKCKQQMHRQFFVYSYPVEIDRCIMCSGVWFDKNELELLQYIFEHKEDFLYGEDSSFEEA